MRNNCPRLRWRTKLDSCSFVDRAHTGFKGKTALILSDRAIGFSCFSADCSQTTFQDLKNLLHEELGRWPQTRFYEPSEEALERQAELEEERRSASPAPRPSVRTSCTTR